MNGYGRRICKTEKRRNENFLNRNYEILGMEECFRGFLFFLLRYLFIILSINLVMYLEFKVGGLG